VNRLCQITGVSSAGYYRFQRRHESRQASMTLRNQIQHIALRWPAYGYRRVRAELVRQDWRVNHKRILRLMRSDNLLCVRRRKVLFHRLATWLPNLSQLNRGPGRDQHRSAVGS
jgi:putative transposase